MADIVVQGWLRKFYTMKKKRNIIVRMLMVSIWCIWDMKARKRAMGCMNLWWTLNMNGAIISLGMFIKMADIMIVLLQRMNRTCNIHLQNQGNI